MSKKLTRRQWTVALTAAAAVTPVAAQPAAGLAEQVRQNADRNRETLAKYKIPMALEPAFRFEA